MLRNGFSIRHERREVMGATTRLYLGATDSTGYVDVPTEQIASIEPDAPASSQVAPSTTNDSLIANASGRTGIDPDLISSVIQQESGFNPHAKSPKGAQGLMQLMPGTAAGLGVKNAFDPESNVNAGTEYLRELLLRNNLDLARALAAYNAGQQRVTQYRGVPPYRETRTYVSRIIRDFNRKKIAQRLSSTKKIPPPSDASAVVPASPAGPAK